MAVTVALKMARADKLPPFRRSLSCYLACHTQGAGCSVGLRKEDTVALPSEFWAAVIGAIAAGGTGYLVQRARSIRAGRAGILCSELRELINWVEGHHQSLAIGQGPWQLSEGARIIADIQRRTLTLGSRDYRATAHLGSVGNAFIDLDHRTWTFTSIGIEPRMEIEEALRQQKNLLRLSLRSIYGYEGWLRRRLAWLGGKGMSDVDGPFTYPHGEGQTRDASDPELQGSVGADYGPTTG